MAEDPELVALLQEFMTAEDVRTGLEPGPDAVRGDGLTGTSVEMLAQEKKEGPSESDLLTTGSGLWGLRRR